MKSSPSGILSVSEYAISQTAPPGHFQKLHAILEAIFALLRAGIGCLTA
jgi:hypothetical protein